MSGKTLGWILMGVAVIWGAIAMIRERLKRRKMVEDRPQLGDSEIYSHFYENSGLPKDAVLHVWHEMASTLHIDPGKIRPSDRVIQYKSKVLQPQSDLDDLDVWLRVMSRKSKLNPEKLDTVDDVVRFAVRCELAA